MKGTWDLAAGSVRMDLHYHTPQHSNISISQDSLEEGGAKGGGKRRGAGGGEGQGKGGVDKGERRVRRRGDKREKRGGK